jgi:dimethylglycine dehydrogenase
MLTASGRILGDVTLARLAPDRLLLIGSPFAESVYMRWLQQHVNTADVRITSRSNELCGLSLSGPLSRDLLQSLCDSDLSNSGLPFLAWRELSIGRASVLAMRLSFTGELGYELYMPAHYQRHVYELLLQEGRRCGLRQFGVRALNSLRLEKGYGSWGREYTQDFSVAEAGLRRLVCMDKERFIGLEAVRTQQAVAPRRQLRLLAIDSANPDPGGGETVLCGGRAIARLTSAAYGYTANHALGFAYLPTQIEPAETGLEVELCGNRVRARVLESAPYDVGGTRLRG